MPKIIQTFNDSPGLEAMFTAARQAGDFDSKAAVAQMRALTPLHEDAERLFDKEIVRVGRNRLVIADDILSSVPSFNLPNWLAVPTLSWDQSADVGNVRVVMDPASRMDGSLPEVEGKSMPIPAIVADFDIGMRAQAVSERSGVPMDTSLFENHARRVNEQIEDLFINGWGSTASGNSIFGLLNAPSVNTVTYEDGPTAWDDSTKTGANILFDVQAMIAKLKGDNFYGPYTLAIEPNYENKLNEDYVSGYPKTIRARLLELVNGGENLRIITADQLPDDRTVMYQRTSDVVQAVLGQTPVQISWSKNGHPYGPRSFAVVACVLPRVRDTYANTSGVCTGNV